VSQSQGPRELRLFNTMSRTTEVLTPRTPGKVGLYTCGPTVYSYAHIGNMRSYVFADLLRRTLERFGYDVTHVMNITDVGHLTDDADCGEDKLEVGARREGLTAWDVARKYTEAFFSHAAKLNVLRPQIICKATDNIPEQIDLIRRLEQRGYTYATDDGVYFDTAKFADYPKLARLDVEGLKQGQRVEVGGKHAKTDFALWKRSPAGEKRQMEWDSPWGRGFPGWHIECSAMAMKFLGEQFDIHTGGVDHIPIHHTNEIAQSECATGKAPFVRYWMHGEFLLVEDEKDKGGEAAKMSKSAGHVLTVDALANRGYAPLAYRLLLLQSHYRKQLKFSFDNLAGAMRAYERLAQAAEKLMKEAGGVTEVALSPAAQGYQDRMLEALASDLNAPQAVAGLFGLVDDPALTPAEKVVLLRDHDEVLGLALTEAHAALAEAAAPVPTEVTALLRARDEARKSRNFAEADRLRQAISDAGYELLDSPQGSSVKRRL
jgi:cysteinyl-tRNA synthetase